jgi:hypothetical protein
VDVGRIVREDLAFPCPWSFVSQPFPYGFEIDAELTLDRQLAPADAVQSGHLVEKNASASLPIILSPISPIGMHTFCTRAARVTIRAELRPKGPSNITNKAVSPLNDILQSIGTVAQEMPTIGDLLRFRRSLPGSTRISTSPVPGDDFNTGMVRKPS